jgi:N-acetylmuramoyl-L-alanine amidase
VVSVAESVERELGTLGDGAAETVLAATARVLAEQLDRRVSWAIAKELRETMAALHAMAPPKREADRSDDLAERRRKARAARGAAS